MNFKEFITESKEGKNIHLEHIEEEILNRGVAGARDSINFLQSLRDMLAGNSNGKTNVTTKWDGAPAVFAGTNPENGKFFVATKSVFAKNAKLNYTDTDIDKNHPGEGLNNKLKVALRYLPKLGIKGILQGDMMFAKGDIDKQTIDGTSYITFKPNTIVYAVPSDAKLAKTILSAQMGIVFHTSYTGRTMEDMKASFNIDLKNLSITKDVWFRDAYFIDASGMATFTESETKEITSLLSQAGRIFRTLNPFVLNKIANTSSINQDIKTFNNTKVRAGKSIENPTTHIREFVAWINDKYTKDILDAKKNETKIKRTAVRNELLRFYRSNATDFYRIIEFQNLISDAKIMIVKKLQQMKQVTNTFLQTDTGFKITSPEGFVAIDKLKGNAVKLVDRLEFSQANFNAAKNWSK